MIYNHLVLKKLPHIVNAVSDDIRTNMIRMGNGRFQPPKGSCRVCDAENFQNMEDSKFISKIQKPDA